MQCRDPKWPATRGTMMKLVNCYHVRKRRRRRQPTSWPGKDAAVPHQIGPSSQALLNQSHAQCGAAPAQSDELLSHPRLRQEVDARHTVRCAQEVPPSDPMDNQASSLTSTATPVLQLQRQRHRFTRKIFNRQLLYLTLLCLVLANEDEIQRQLHKLKMPEAPDPASTRSNSGSLFLGAQAHQDANRLYEDLMMTYNRIVRPVQNESDKVVVRLGLKLSQLMDVVSSRFESFVRWIGTNLHLARPALDWLLSAAISGAIPSDSSRSRALNLSTHKDGTRV